MKEVKEKPDSFDQFNDRELMLNFRRNLEKAKELANSANGRSLDASSDVRKMEAALVAYLDKTDNMLAEMERAIVALNLYLNLPWYKKIFHKGYKRAGSR